MDKMKSKKKEILNTALPLVRKLGFEAVSIANLAKEVGMSKSGLFAHFNSKEKMHLMILDHAAIEFTQHVIVPAIKVERGLPRLRKILELWLGWYQVDKEGTCPFVAAGVEYDFRPGPVKERLQFHISSLVSSIKKAVDICIEEGHFNKNANSDQIAFEIYSFVMGSQIYRKTMSRKDTDNLISTSLKQLYKRYQQ
jgi:AcrR family transcriptional regulator